MNFNNSSRAVQDFLAGKKKRILVVDDEPVNQMILGKILSEDYQVDYAFDGIEAMKIVRESSKDISLVLLDLIMPRMGGMTVLKTIKTDPMLAHIPVIVLTNLWDAEIEVLNAGACDFLKKPYDMPEVIRARVARAIHDAEVKRSISDIENSDAHNTFISKFEKALSEGHIEVAYQPIVRTLTGTVCGAEALPKWNDPEQGTVSPGLFLPALQQCGLIHKLDLFTIRQVCENYKDTVRNRMGAVPVSVNLSEADFELCNFFEELEKLIKEYDMPRDMICIEVSEGELVRSDTRMSAEIDRLRRAGYEVWIDEFGKQYASLNSLKRKIFDLLKIDISALTASLEHSLNLLVNVINMSKAIGVQTLALGVDTEKQYDSLCRMGCEKVQGKYISVPLAYRDFQQFCRERAVNVESRSRSRFYDTAGAVCMAKDEPVGLLLYQKGRFHLLNANDAFMQVIEKLEVDSIERANEVLSDVKSYAYDHCSRLCGMIMRSRKEEECSTWQQNREITGRGRLAAELGEERIFIISLSTPDESEIYYTEINERILKSVDVLNESIKLINLNKDQIEIIKENGLFAYKSTNYESLDEYRRHFAEVNIYPVDLHDYMEFTDAESLEERMANAEDGFLCGCFRTRISLDGNYTPMVYHIIPSERSKGVYIETIRRLPDAVAVAGNVQNLVKEGRMGLDIGDEEISYREIMDCFFGNTDGKWFIKDKERRFVKAGRGFLDYYGLKSADEIIGRTDDEIGWHIDNEPYRTDENAVLKHGDMISNSPGICIIRGVSHHILATKMPLYHDGRIVGLMGYFKDVEKVDEREAGIDSYRFLDPITGLMNQYGCMNTLFEFEENHHINGNDFAIVMMDIPEYKRIRENYGSDTGNMLLVAVTRIMKRHVGFVGSISRVYDGRFVFMLKRTDSAVIHNMMTAIVAELQAMHEIAGNPCTLFPRYSVAMASETETLSELPVLLNERLNG